MNEEGFSLQLITRPRATKVYRDRRKMLLILLLAIVFFGACFMVFLQDLRTGELGPFREFMLGGAFAIISIGVLLNFILLFDSKPAVEFHENGLIARDISSDMIPWSGILGVSARKMRSSKLVEVQIDSAAVEKIALSRRARINRLFGFRHHFFNATALDHDQDFLIQLIDFYRKKNETA